MNNQPLVLHHFSVPGTTVRFTTACFAGNDWSLGPLYDPEDLETHSGLVSRVGQALAGLGAQHVYAPTPTAFNGEIVRPSDLTTIIPFGNGAVLRRNRNKPADGVFLTEPTDAFAFSGGGCGLVVACLGNKLIAAHAGRESVVDRLRVMTRGEREARVMDLVEMMLLALCVPSSDVRDVHLWPLYFIPPEAFVHRSDDPMHGSYNQAAADYLPRRYGALAGRVENDALYMDLPGIITAQAKDQDVPEAQVHLGQAYLHEELPHTRNGGGRYLVAAVRES